ncbi:MAG: aldo/keto reductase [Balneolales bacterium]
MEYRNIGISDLKLSAITFGAWAAGGWMWGGNDQKEAVEAIKTSYDHGVTSIDTAPVYGQGASEQIVGEAIKDLPRDKVQICTKFGMRWNIPKGTHYLKSNDNQGNEIDIYKYASKESIIEECETSLRNLGTDYIDLYQIHWPDITTPIQESMEAVAQLIKEGKVRHAGVCNYNVEQMIEADKYINLLSNQVPYSMVKRRIERDVIPYCSENRKSILAYSPLERGLLTGKMNPGHQFAEGDHRAGIYFFSDENLKRTRAMLDKIQPIADDKNATFAQLVIRWTLEQPGITIALVGARNGHQALQNAKAIEVKLSNEEMEYITEQVTQVEMVK